MHKLRTAAALILISILASPAFAQQANDAYQVNAITVLKFVTLTPFVNVPASTHGDVFQVRIINTGQIGSPIDAATNHGTVCADIYVFDANQEMMECCSCPITANGLLILSVNSQLVQDPLTGPIPGIDQAPVPDFFFPGVVKIVGDRGCNEQLVTQPVEGGLRAWVTRGTAVSNGVVRSLATTETQFAPAPLTGQESQFLGQACSFVQYLGSGRGTCKCGTGNATG